MRRLALLVACVALAALAAAPVAHAAKQKRVVALTPFSANMLADLGIKPVAIGETLGTDQHLDKKLNNVPRLPLSHASNGPNLEQLAERDPDIVFSERTWRAGHEAIENLGIDVIEADPYRVPTSGAGSRRSARSWARSARRRRSPSRIADEVIDAGRGNQGAPEAC